LLNIFCLPLENTDIANQGGHLPENKDIPMDDINGERRMEKRLLTNAQVEIAGIDNGGNSFTEVTKVKNFSDVGCQFRTQIPLRCGTIVAIKPLGPNGQSMPQEPFKLFEIVWTARCVTGWLAGARVSPSEGISDRESDSANTKTGGVNGHTFQKE
jgi:hypothetical protein